MIARTTIHLSTRKVITLPKLSPTHTSAKILKRLVPHKSYVIEYQPVLLLQCSSDLIADPADRISPNHQPIMLLECMEEGTLHWNNDINTGESQWLKVGTMLGEIVDEDDDEGLDEEWKWQAYLHENGE